MTSQWRFIGISFERCADRAFQVHERQLALDTHGRCALSCCASTRPERIEQLEDVHRPGGERRHRRVERLLRPWDELRIEQRARFRPPRRGRSCRSISAADHGRHRRALALDGARARLRRPDVEALLATRSRAGC